MVTRAEWVDAFLTAQSCPQTPENVVAVLTWIRSEWGDRAPIPATWNPLNTTLDFPPQTVFNSAGVKNYETFEQGVTANSNTLSLSYYPAIRGALQVGNNAAATIGAIFASPWGSKPNASYLAYVRANLAAESALVVGAGLVPPGPSSSEDFVLDAQTIQQLRDIIQQELEAAIGGASMVPPDPHATVLDITKHVFGNVKPGP
jgi:hypothetical protein